MGLRVSDSAYNAELSPPLLTTHFCEEHQIMLTSNLFLLLASTIAQFKSAAADPAIVQGPCKGQVHNIGASYYPGNRVDVPPSAKLPAGFTLNKPVDDKPLWVQIHYTPGSAGKTKFHLYLQNWSAETGYAQLAFYPGPNTRPNYVFTLPASNMGQAVSCVELDSSVLQHPITVQSYRLG